jgi:hypothetical protein
MQRIGYDTDTERYTFRDANGNLFESEPGSRYGEFRPAGHEPPQSTSYTPPKDIEERNLAVDRNHRAAVRTMLPFALLIFVFLLLVFRGFNGGFGFGGGGSDKMRADHGISQILDCHNGNRQIQIEKGDTCWTIAEGHSLGVDELLELQRNADVDCDQLRIGQGMCVPV